MLQQQLPTSRSPKIMKKSPFYCTSQRRCLISTQQLCRSQSGHTQCRKQQLLFTNTRLLATIYTRSHERPGNIYEQKVRRVQPAGEEQICYHTAFAIHCFIWQRNVCIFGPFHYAAVVLNCERRIPPLSHSAAGY